MKDFAKLLSFGFLIAAGLYLLMVSILMLGAESPELKQLGIVVSISGIGLILGPLLFTLFRKKKLKME